MQRFVRVVLVFTALSCIILTGCGPKSPKVYEPKDTLSASYGSNVALPAGSVGGGSRKK